MSVRPSGTEPRVGLLARSVPLRQMPTLVAFVAALVVIAVAPDAHPYDHDRVLSAVVVEALATALAFALARRPARDRWMTGDLAAVVVPVLSLLAIGLLCNGTGGPSSLFTPMLILPVAWIAAEPGRWYIALASVGTFAALAIPFVPGGPVDDDDRSIWRLVYGPFVYALAAVTVNETARRARIHLSGLWASEARLRAADRLTRSVLDAVTEQAIIGTDRTGLIDVWNPGAAHMLGLTASATQGHRRVGEFVSPAELSGRRHAQAEVTDFEALTSGVGPGRPDVAEWTWIRADGSTLPVEVSVTARQDVAGATVGFIFVAADQTRAHEAARMRDQFVGMISHELRTPLSAVLGHLELLRDDPLSDDQRGYIAVAERNVHRLLRLVNDLLFTSQVEGGGFRLEASEVDLREVVTESVQSAAPAAAHDGVRVVAEIPSHGIRVDGDVERLGQACDNLISNALKFTPRGGTVTVTLAAGDSEATLAVSDTGIGVATQEIGQLFGPFFRASSAVQNAIPGVGLGLTVTRAIVAAHHGSISVSSVEGVGTTFTVHLPTR